MHGMLHSQYLLGIPSRGEIKVRFTKDQYDSAIQHLKDASEQLAPDGRNCTVCGDGGHQAFECGHNPLVAMLMCKHIAGASQVLHEHLHYLAGYDMYMGHQRGPANVVLPMSPEEVAHILAGTNRGAFDIFAEAFVKLNSESKALRQELITLKEQKL